MEILKINSDNLDKKAIRRTVEILKNGGTVIYPTDTVYGFGVDAFNEKAIKKIFQIKGRDFNKPISIIVRDLEMIKKLANFDKNIEKILKKIFPGPVTAILSKTKNLSDILTSGSNKIGIRIPECKFTKDLMNELDFPITTTSANISGKPASGDLQNILNQFRGRKIKPDLVVDAGILPKSLPSTIIDLTGIKPKIIRQGAICLNF